VRILVTGGAGYVGSVSVAALLEAGHAVVVLDDLSTGHRSAVPDRARLEVGTYADGKAVTSLLERARIDAILHCAARSLVGESGVDPARYYIDNVAGGVALLEAARAAGVNRLVFSSSAAVYGVPDATPIPEDAPLRPINPYGETKRTFEGALAWYGRAYGLRSVSLRYFNVAGATESLGEDHDRETHLVPNVLAAAEGRLELTVFGDDYPTPDGTCVRDYIHVDDLAQAHLLALERIRSTNTSCEYNLGTGVGSSVRQVIMTVEQVTGLSVPIQESPRRPGDPAELVADPAKAMAELGWRPIRSDLPTIIESANRWYIKHFGNV
jgi:UDP-glucose-4-epimerase GalE